MQVTMMMRITMGGQSTLVNEALAYYDDYYDYYIMMMIIP